MITSLHVKNYKCLRDIRVDLRPFTVVIGKNDTGKSSLLEAIQTLGQLVGPTVWKRRGPGAIDTLIFRGAEPQSITWTVEIASSARNRLPGKAKYSLGISPHGGCGPEIYVEDESLIVENAAVGVGFEQGHETDILVLSDGTKQREFSPDFGRAQTALAAVHGQRDYPTLNAVSQALTTTVKYRFEPTRLAADSAYQIDTSDPHREPRLHDDGYGLPTVLDYLLGVKRSIFDEIEKELQEAIPFVKAIELRPCMVPSPWTASAPGKSISFGLSSGNHEVPAPLASDGVMLLLAYLTVIHSPNAPSVILIEEPENGLHPRQLKRIAEYLKRLTDERRTASRQRGYAGRGGNGFPTLP
jgi:predicted ATPase